MKREIIVFHWKDASMHGTIQRTRKELEDVKLIEGIVAGHIVNETSEHITVAMDLFFAGQPDIIDDNFRVINTYPKSGIQKIIKRFLLPNL